MPANLWFVQITLQSNSLHNVETLITVYPSIKYFQIISSDIKFEIGIQTHWI